MSPFAKFRKYLLRTAGVVLTVFLLFVIASWVLVVAVDLEKQRTHIEKLASQELGRDVHIDGPIVLKPSLFPRFSVENLRIVNTEWADQPNFLTVEQFEVEISLLSLLLDKLVLQDIELNGAAIHLQRGPDQSANWVFKSEPRSKNTSGLRPEIVGFHASRVLIMLHPADRPPVSINIDHMHASLRWDEPVEISIDASISKLPLKIDLQGGTLTELLDRETRWPLKATLDTNVRKIDFEGYITDLTAFKEIELQLSSEEQSMNELRIFGPVNDQMLGRYQGALSINSNADGYELKLAGEAYDFDLSKLYKPSQRSKKPALKFKEIKFTSRSSGKTLSEILRGYTFDATGAGFEFQYPVDAATQHFYVAKIDDLHAKTIQDKGIEFTLKGSANQIPIKGKVSFKRLLYGLWQDENVPVDLSVQSRAAHAQFTGNLSKAQGKIKFDGKAAVQADNLKAVGGLLGRDWPESAEILTTAEVKFADGNLTVSNILGQLGTQKASGKVSLNYGDEYDLLIEAFADRFDLHDALQDNKLPENLAFNLNGLNLKIQGKSQTFIQSVLEGYWEIAAGHGQVGWQSKPADEKYIFSFHDIHLTADDNESIMLSAQGVHNHLKHSLNIKAGSLKDLLNESEAFPLNLELSGDGLSGSLNAVLQKPMADFALTGDLDVNGRLSTIGQMINVELPKQYPAKLHANVAIRYKDIKFTDIVVTTDGIDLNGDLSYQDKVSPNLVINSSGSINLTPYFDKNSRQVNSATKQVLDRSHIVSDSPFDFGKYRSMDAVISINDLGIKYANTDILMINGRLTADKGLYRLDPLEIRSIVDSAVTNARLELDSTKNITQARFSLQARNFDYGGLLKHIEITNEVVGTLDLHVDMKGKGNSLRDLMGSANGDIQLVANKGLVPKWLLELWGSGLIRIIIPTNWMEESVTDLNCAVGLFKLVDGDMRSQTLLADTKRVTVAGEVAVNWRDETIVGLFKPQPKEATLFHLGTPIELSGTLAHPIISSAESGFMVLGKLAVGLTGPAALIVMFGDIGAEEKNPCEALLNQNATMEGSGGKD